MRIYLSLIITAIGLSFVTAYFALNLQKDHFADASEVREIRDLEQEFTGTPALLELDLSSMYPSRDYFQLIQPVVPTFAQSTNFSLPCRKESGKMTRTQTEKRDVWEAFRCRELTELPESFFDRSPYIHESGVSYAYLAVSSGMLPFMESGWIKKHLNFFHLSELALLPVESLDGNFKILATLDHSHAEAFLRGDSSILTETSYLSKAQGHVYKVYPRLEFEKFLNRRAYFAKPAALGEKCFYNQGTLCWFKDTQNILKKWKASSMAIFLGSVLILILVCLSLYSRIMAQAKEEERKRHALRVLTHELRTPVANLLLQIERLNQNSRDLAPEVLEDLLKIEGEVYRLKRLAEKSTSYLSSQGDRGLLSFELTPIPSLNEFIEDVVSSYDERGVRFEPMGPDSATEVDGYWLSVCVKNLIENALTHGRGPVSVSVRRSEGSYSIDVRDQGSLAGVTLESLMTSEAPSSSSRGLGLGLSIVERIMREMGGKLTLTSNPSTFSLHIKRSP